MEDLLFLLKENLWTDSENGMYITFIMLMIGLSSAYEFIIYRLVSHRTTYNKSFHISIAIMPYFIGAIIYALQSNILITLGTIGALAIIRYRTAIKDPVDMIYILWSVFIGIACGCQLFKLCIATSLIATLTLIFINLISDKFLSSPSILVINSNLDIQEELDELLKTSCKKYKLKSRTLSRDKQIDYVYQIDAKDKKYIIKTLDGIKNIVNYSFLERDSEDIV